MTMPELLPGADGTGEAAAEPAEDDKRLRGSSIEAPESSKDETPDTAALLWEVIFGGGRMSEGGAGKCSAAGLDGKEETLSEALSPNKFTGLNNRFVC